MEKGGEVWVILFRLLLHVFFFICYCHYFCCYCCSCLLPFVFWILLVACRCIKLNFSNMTNKRADGKKRRKLFQWFCKCAMCECGYRFPLMYLMEREMLKHKVRIIYTKMYKYKHIENIDEKFVFFFFFFVFFRYIVLCPQEVE